MINGELELTPYCEWCIQETTAHRKGMTIHVTCKRAGCGYNVKLLEDEYSEMLERQNQASKI